MNQQNSKPILNMVNSDPEQAAAISKLVDSHIRGPARDTDGSRKITVPNSHLFRNRLSKRAKKSVDAAAVLKLLPDVELGIRILTSCILSPSDMTGAELNWLGPEELLSSDVNATMLKRIRQHFTKVYKIKPLLPKILRKCLAEDGSYPVCVIPENVIDDLINGQKKITMESLRGFVHTNTKMVKSIGILGGYKETGSPDVGLAVESLSSTSVSEEDGYCRFVFADKYEKNEYVYVTDNPMVLRIHDINTSARKEKYSDAYKQISLESNRANNISEYRIERTLYNRKQTKGDQVVAMKRPDELHRKSIGNPLIKRFPAESVIPVFIPGESEKQIGFFVCLDEEGVPIQAPGGDQYYNNLSSGFGGATNSSMTSGIIQRVKSNLGSNVQFDNNSVKHLEMSVQIYSELVEKDLLTRVKNGIRSSNVSISSNHQIYEIMLARTLSKKLTQMLYIPADYMTYIAFKHGDDGIGQSLLDDTATINALRIVLLFSDIIGSIKNSIGRTMTTLKLDERDPDPMKTIEIAQNEIVRGRQLSVPLSVSNVTDITDFIQRAGFEWKFEGHPGVPDVSFDFQDVQSNKQRPDSDLQDALRKASIMGTYVSPEMVDNGFNSEFAASVVANNILFSKRIIELQEIFNPQLSDHLRKCVRFSQPLMSDLKEILLQNKEKLELDEIEVKDYAGNIINDERKEKIVINDLLNHFVDNFCVELPKPTSVTLEQQMTDLESYSSAVDKAIDLAYMNDQIINENSMGEFSQNIETLKALYKAHFIRKYLTEKGILTELADITSLNEEGRASIDMPADTESHLLSLIRSMVPTVAVMNTIKKKMEEASDELGFKPPEDVPPPSEEPEGGDVFGGGDELGGGADQLGEVNQQGNLEAQSQTTENQQQVAPGQADQGSPDSEPEDQTGTL
jgi:hypothetical protein